MPNAAQITYSNLRLLPAMRPDLEVAQPVSFNASIAVTRGAILTQVSSTGRYTLYIDGTDTARAIALYDFITDASGNVIFTTTAGQAAGDLGQTYPTAPVSWGGWYDVADLNMGGTAGISGSVVSGLGGRLPSTWSQAHGSILAF